MPATVKEGDPVKISLIDISDNATKKLNPKPSIRNCVIQPNSFLMTLGATPSLVLPHTPKRKSALIVVNGTGVVAFGKSQSDCQSAANDVINSGQYTGNVAYVNAAEMTSPMPIKGTTELWAVLVSQEEPISNISAYGQGVTAASPATGAVIASIPATSLPAGAYSVTTQTYLDGTTPASTDDDNIGLHVAAVNFGHLNQPGIADTISNNGPFIIDLNGAQSLSLVVVTTVIDGTVYHGAITATPYGIDEEELIPTTVSVFKEIEE